MPIRRINRMPGRRARSMYPLLPAPAVGSSPACRPGTCLRRSPGQVTGPLAGREEGATLCVVRVLIAPDSFTGTLTAGEAARAIADGWARHAPGDTLDLCPLSDGGPGFVDVLA